MIGVGWVGLVTAACFAELGHPVIARDILPEKVESLSRGEITIHEPGLGELLAPQRRAAHLHHRDAASCSRGRGCSSSASTRRRPTPATPTSRACAPWSRSCRPSSDHVLVMKSTVPAGTGEFDPARPARPRLRLLSRVPQGGLGGRGLPASRPRRGRRRPRRRGGGRRGRRALRAARRRDRPYRRRQRGDDQARLQRLPGHQDLLHQRDRQRLRGGRRRRRRSRPRHGPRRAHRLGLPPRRHRLRRLMFPKGRRAR